MFPLSRTPKSSGHTGNVPFPLSPHDVHSGLRDGFRQPIRPRGRRLTKRTRTPQTSELPTRRVDDTCETTRRSGYTRKLRLRPFPRHTHHDAIVCRGHAIRFTVDDYVRASHKRLLPSARRPDDPARPRSRVTPVVLNGDSLSRSRAPKVTVCDDQGDRLRVQSRPSAVHTGVQNGVHTGGHVRRPPLTLLESPGHGREMGSAGIPDSLARKPVDTSGQGRMVGTPPNLSSHHHQRLYCISISSCRQSPTCSLVFIVALSLAELMQRIKSPARNGVAGLRRSVTACRVVTARNGTAVTDNGARLE